MFSGASEIMEIMLILFDIFYFSDFFFILRFKATRILHKKQGFSDRGCPLI